MSFVREAFVGVVAAVGVSLLVLGAIALGMTEGMVLPDASQVTEVQSTSSMETLFPGAVFTTPTPRTTTKGPHLVAATTQPVVVLCAAKASEPGWKEYTVQSGDTVDALAAKFGVSAERILEINCLGRSVQLQATWTLLLPPLAPTTTPMPPSATATVTATPRSTLQPCIVSPPRGWVPYTIQSGDTLFKIAGNYGTTVYQLSLVNCIPNSGNITLGDRIYVPNVPPRNTATRTPLPPSATSRPATNTPSFTPRPSVTASLTPTATFTIVSTWTFTPAATKTFTPTATFTHTPVPPSATWTITPSGTILASNTSLPTATFTKTP